MVHTKPLSYQTDSAELFEKIRHLPMPLFFDSGQPSATEGRFDILCAEPASQLRHQQGVTEHIAATGERTLIAGSPFQALKDLLVQHGLGQINDQTTAELPFVGGAAGYFSYDLGRALEHLPTTAMADIALPEMQVGLYTWAVVVDHQQRSAQLVYTDAADSERLDLIYAQLTASTASEAASFKLSAPFQSNLSKEQYQQRFDKALAYIHAGDCYQVNLAQRFSAEYEGDSWQAYKQLRHSTGTPFSAYGAFAEGEILCLSPERFLQVEQLQVSTKPIKGTRPRGPDAISDLKLKKDLFDSSKDRAENLMIVDLLRNDLGKTCVTGSVQVTDLFAIESYANVHHMVSTIVGRLNHPVEVLDLLEGCFPGGSITGAPKVRAMEIIEELEPHRRSVYCGSMGYISLNGNVDTNICIRTLVAHQGQLHCWAGGGLVADSECAAEYQETYDKVNNLIQTLEAFKP